MSIKITEKEGNGNNEPCRHKDIAICERTDGRLVDVCASCNYERILEKREENYWKEFIKDGNFVFLKYPLQKYKFKRSVLLG